MANGRTRWLFIATYLAIFCLALIPRIADAPEPMTGDEPLWMGRAIRFAKAVDHGHPSGTYQSGHPGVTTMWVAIVGAGLGAMTRLDGAHFSLLHPADA